LTCKKYRHFFSTYAYKSQLFRYVKGFKKYIRYPVDRLPGFKTRIIIESSCIILQRKTKHVRYHIDFSITKHKTGSKLEIIFPTGPIFEISGKHIVVSGSLSHEYRKWTGYLLHIRELEYLFMFLDFLLELYIIPHHKFLDLFTE
jgi:hypothetical protein